MLHQSRHAPVLRVVALHSLHKRRHHRAVEKRVFAVAFLGASPTRIASHIRVGRSNYNSALAEPGTLKDVTSFVPFDLARLSQHAGIPRLSHADPLRKNRGGHDALGSPVRGSALGQTMNAFDVARTFNAQPWDARVGAQTCD